MFVANNDCDYSSFSYSIQSMNVVDFVDFFRISLDFLLSFWVIGSWVILSAKFSERVSKEFGNKTRGTLVSILIIP